MIKKEAEILPAPSLAALPHRTKHALRQAIIFGATLHEAAEEVGLPLEVAVDYVRSELEAAASPRGRKAIALARIDELGAMLVRRGVDGDLDAINTWIRLQKREATLAGLDEPDRQERRVVIEAPWLKARRLSYKDDLELAEDIEARQLPPPPDDEPNGD